MDGIRFVLVTPLIALNFLLFRSLINEVRYEKIRPLDVMATLSCTFLLVIVFIAWVCVLAYRDAFDTLNVLALLVTMPLAYLIARKGLKLTFDAAVKDNTGTQ